MIPPPLEHLMRQLGQLPGFGPRSARRAALHLLLNAEVREALQDALFTVGDQVRVCSVCGNVGIDDPCHICTDTTRDGATLCVVDGVADLWAIERSRAFRGKYHVLGGLLSAMEGVGPDDLRLSELITRLRTEGQTEVILALGASVEAQTTAHVVAQKLKPLGVTVTGLANGLPVGAGVDYMDDGTLNLALAGRRPF
jgi:recombination protein RecR